MVILAGETVTGSGTTNQTSAGFVGNGNNLTNLNAANLTGGPVTNSIQIAAGGTIATNGMPLSLVVLAQHGAGTAAPTFSVQTGPGAALTTGSGSQNYVLPGSHDLASQIVFTNGAGGASTNSGGVVLGTFTFASAMPSTNYSVSLTGFTPMIGTAYTGSTRVATPYGYVTNQTATGFSIVIGSTATTLPGSSTTGLSIGIIP